MMGVSTGLFFLFVTKPFKVPERRPYGTPDGYFRLPFGGNLFKIRAVGLLQNSFPG